VARPIKTVPQIKTTKVQTGAKRMQISLHEKLVLGTWCLAKFGVKTVEEIAASLKDEQLEGLDEENVHYFIQVIISRHGPSLTGLTADKLRIYDANIARHTAKINANRIRNSLPVVRWKYFQYLSLLFVEMYLDSYFYDPVVLRAELNETITSMNTNLTGVDVLTKFPLNIDPKTQLNKVALWSATGSGKTLLMHVNLLQYTHYLGQCEKVVKLNKIMLLTPNDGLSQQHEREFVDSGISAELFDKSRATMFAGQIVEILDIHKLRRGDPGENTVSVESLEGNNLVLVDEGHRGAAGGEDGAWFSLRNDLCSGGFSFEYSATFGQAVSGDIGLTDVYSKSIIFDYSYKYFYGDGYGKDFEILNLDEGIDKSARDTYLVACLMVFFEQIHLYKSNRTSFIPFLIEKPLWVFVGSSVNAVRTENKSEVSDVVDILQFMAGFVANKKTSIATIEKILNDGLMTSAGQDIFARRFAYLREIRITATQVFNQTLELIFNAPGGGSIYVENLRGSSGEIALRIGADNEPFGVINVGDTSKLVKLCASQGMNVGELEFKESLFQRISESRSPINILIGSKKFTEGWNSWRVSTLGLMNVGKSEGTQIIQLFGRGIRLKGYGWSLKRSARGNLPAHVARAKHISLLETLNVFGIHAKYMVQFRQHLEEESPKDNDPIGVCLPIIKNLGFLKLKTRLKTLRVKKSVGGITTEGGDAFRQLGPVIAIHKPDPLDKADLLLRQNKVQLNLFPKIATDQSNDISAGDIDPTKHEKRHLTKAIVGLLDIDRIVFEIVRYRKERNRHNVVITREKVIELLLDHEWYDLYMPAELLRAIDYSNVHFWSQVSTTLLRKYVDSFQAHQRSKWEQPHLEYVELEQDDPNFPDDDHYTVYVEKAKIKLQSDLEVIAAKIGSGDLASWSIQLDAPEARPLEKVLFESHLYEPLLRLEEGIPQVSPKPLNGGESRFINDLKVFQAANQNVFENMELYLLRNLTRGRGIGFFEAGNFYPDFIMWLVRAGTQEIIFIDPKGLSHHGVDDPKILFHKTIKEIEVRLADTSVHLHSIIVSGTSAATLSSLWGLSKSEIQSRNIIFQEDADYIDQFFTTVLGPIAVK
jgi:hypothetical protein